MVPPFRDVWVKFLEVPNINDNSLCRTQNQSLILIKKIINKCASVRQAMDGFDNFFILNGNNVKNLQSHPGPFIVNMPKKHFSQAV